MRHRTQVSVSGGPSMCTSWWIGRISGLAAATFVAMLVIIGLLNAAAMPAIFDQLTLSPEAVTAFRTAVIRCR